MLQGNRAHGKACPNPPRAFALLLGEIDADAESERKTFDFALFAGGRPLAAGLNYPAGTPSSLEGATRPGYVAMTFGTLAPPPADAPPDEALAYSEARARNVASRRGGRSRPRAPSSIQPGSINSPDRQLSNWAKFALGRAAWSRLKRASAGACGRRPGPFPFSSGRFRRSCLGVAVGFCGFRVSPRCRPQLPVSL